MCVAKRFSPCGEVLRGFFFVVIVCDAIYKDLSYFVIFNKFYLHGRMSIYEKKGVCNFVA